MNKIKIGKGFIAKSGSVIGGRSTGFKDYNELKGLEIGDARAQRTSEYGGNHELKIGKCGYEYDPFECQKMPCYNECEGSEFKENPE